MPKKHSLDEQTYLPILDRVYDISISIIDDCHNQINNLKIQYGVTFAVILGFISQISEFKNEETKVIFLIYIIGTLTLLGFGAAKVHSMNRYLSANLSVEKLKSKINTLEAILEFLINKHKKKPQKGESHTSIIDADIIDSLKKIRKLSNESNDYFYMGCLIFSLSVTAYIMGGL